MFKTNKEANVDIGRVPFALSSAGKRKPLMSVLPAP
jgi:hypothetical protein